MLTENNWVFSQQLKKNFGPLRKISGYATAASSLKKNKMAARGPPVAAQDSF